MPHLTITPDASYRTMGATPHEAETGWAAGYCPKCGSADYEYTHRAADAVLIAGLQCEERYCSNVLCRLRWWIETTTYELIAYQPQGEEVMTITDTSSTQLSEHELDTVRNLGIELPEGTLTVSETHLVAHILGFNTKLSLVAGERDHALEINGSITREANRLRDNIATIGSRLADEAKDRGWCSDYERFISDTNEQLHDVEGGKLPATTFDEVLTLTLTVRVSGNGRLDNARSALSQAAEFRLADQVRSYTSDNYESVEFETVDVRSAFTTVDED